MAKTMSREVPTDQNKWERWFYKLLVSLTKKYSVPKPTVRLISADTLSDYDPEFEKDPRFRQSRGVFDPDWEKNGVRDPTILLLIGDTSKVDEVHTGMRIMSILFHEYHHYLDWVNPSRRRVPKRIPKLPYGFEVRPGELLRKERWIWYRAQMDIKEFSRKNTS